MNSTDVADSQQRQKIKKKDDDKRNEIFKVSHMIHFKIDSEFGLNIPKGENRRLWE